MKVVFRVDASFETGSGHTMRCLTLADSLTERGHTCDFIVREQPGHLIKLIETKGYRVHALPAIKSDANDILEYTHSQWLLGGQQRDSEDTLAILDCSRCDWLVVDHYGIGAFWERELRKVCRNILAIDDLADRTHDCDVLLDQNIGRYDSDYDGLVPNKCDRLIGPKYALLRTEFTQWREKSLARRRQYTELNKILISLGGVDKNNVTGEVLALLETSSLPDSLILTVVLGQQSPWLENIQQRATQSRFGIAVKQGVTNMAELMSQADLAIGAAGSTSWERCCLGLPTIMLILAENQKGIAKGLEESKASVTAGVEDVVSKVKRFVTDSIALITMSERAASICDGKGAKKLIEILERNIES